MTLTEFPEQFFAYGATAVVRLRIRLLGRGEPLARSSVVEGCEAPAATGQLQLLDYLSGFRRSRPAQFQHTGHRESDNGTVIGTTIAVLT